jgi:hypothetical protein
MMTKALEIGIIPRLKYGGIIGYAIATSFYGYVYGLEFYSNNPAMKKMIDTYGHFEISE